MKSLRLTAAERKKEKGELSPPGTARHAKTAVAVADLTFHGILEREEWFSKVTREP